VGVHEPNSYSGYLDALAAFLPNIFLEWRAIFPHKGGKGTAVLSRAAAAKSEHWS
jgi:hypothetical protein